MVIPEIPDAWKYVISSLVGGGIAIFVTFLNNRYQLKKDSKSWEKEKLWEGYQKCISNLNLIDCLWTNLSAECEVNYVLKIEDREKNFTLYLEIFPYLYWIIYNYPNPQSEEIKALKEIIGEEEIKTTFQMKKLNFLISNPKLLNPMKQELTQLMVNDPRLSKS